MRGKKEFETMFNATRGKFQIEAMSEFEEIAVHGDWAHVASRLAVNMKSKDGSADQSRAGHTLTILRKDRGKWVVARDANLLAPVSS
jgi:ketosteroid isomerase-like protein